MDQKKEILDYLEKCYSGAKTMDDVEMMCRLSRAIIAFSYDNFDEEPDWGNMLDAYFAI